MLNDTWISRCCCLLYNLRCFNVLCLHQPRPECFLKSILFLDYLVQSNPPMNSPMRFNQSGMSEVLECFSECSAAGREERVQHSGNNIPASIQSGAGKRTQATAQAGPVGTKPNPDIAPPDQDTAAISTKNKLRDN